MREWPLVVFTIALQLACGLALAATIFEWKARRQPAMRNVGLAVFPIAALGLLGSLFHLGRPLSLLRAFRNLGSSRLSLEVLFTSAFVVAAMAYSYAWWKGECRQRTALGIVTSGLGLAAVGSSTMIYLLPARPAWDSGWVPLSFAGTTLLLSGFGAASLIGGRGEPRLLRVLLAAACGGCGAIFVSAMWMLANVSRRPPDSFLAARLHGAMHLVTREYAGWFGLYLLLTVVVPVAAAVRVWPSRGNIAPGEPAYNSVVPSVFAATVVGAVIGRTIMFSMGLSLPPF